MDFPDVFVYAMANPWRLYPVRTPRMVALGRMHSCFNFSDGVPGKDSTCFLTVAGWGVTEWYTVPPDLSQDWFYWCFFCISPGIGIEADKSASLTIQPDSSGTCQLDVFGCKRMPIQSTTMVWKRGKFWQCWYVHRRRTMPHSYGHSVEQKSGYITSSEAY